VPVSTDCESGSTGFATRRLRLVLAARRDPKTDRPS
jgi:hypothetical protein